MCGVAGVVLAFQEDNAAPELLETALALQHRGQEAAGIACAQAAGQTIIKKGLGLVLDVFSRHENRLDDASGPVGICHVRYSTTRTHKPDEAQPFRAAAMENLTLAHNGHISNNDQLSEQLEDDLYSDNTTNSDSETLLRILASNLSRKLKESNAIMTVPQAVFSALSSVYQHCIGSFACVAMLGHEGVFAFRDSNGIKPLVWGKRKADKNGAFDYMCASESVALERLGYQDITDVLPGHAIFFPASIQGHSTPVIAQISLTLSYTPDIFEFVYFARPESTIDGISVHDSRERMGINLAIAIEEVFKRSNRSLDEIDCVIPVPETSVTCAITTAERLQKPLCIGLNKNKYISRTFIMPTQGQRSEGVRRKFTPLRSAVAGRNVLLIDDSIVRGTTSREIVRQMQAVGARKVFFASASPPIRYNHIYGIDLADSEKLIANSRSEADIKQTLGCDELIYLPFDALVESIQYHASGSKITGFEHGVFTGVYITGKV